VNVTAAGQAMLALLDDLSDRLVAKVRGEPPRAWSPRAKVGATLLGASALTGYRSHLKTD
jgi:hypothetical protein